MKSPPEQSPTSTRYDTIGAIFFCSLPVGPLARSSRADHDCGFAVRPEGRSSEATWTMPFPVFCNDAAAEKRPEKRPAGPPIVHGNHTQHWQ
ncbi:hypothetical protein CFAM422_010276 [Trichoderma lentiforme]|uniref:Uncharacterized protein n=1 Tax=Trichoderma lentiforme TaxID=1567552 RepID=A0A9P4X8V4_9HYPO|nr:hypothetical protein CFAM422_010276 [Trichoderma lentiforme]